MQPSCTAWKKKFLWYTEELKKCLRSNRELSKGKVSRSSKGKYSQHKAFSMSNRRVTSGFGGSGLTATTEAEPGFSGFEWMESEEVEPRNGYEVEETVS